MQNHISKTTFVLMLTTAGLFDLTQFLINFIPIFGQIMSDLTSIFAFLTFFLWFKMYGISFMSPKRFLTMGGGFLLEMIPILNDLPAWMMVVTGIVLMHRAEEMATLIPIAKTALSTIQKLPGGKQMLNKNIGSGGLSMLNSAPAEA